MAVSTGRKRGTASKKGSAKAKGQRTSAAAPKSGFRWWMLAWAVVLVALVAALAMAAVLR